MALSEADKKQLADENLDPRKLFPSCELHAYYGPVSRANLAVQRIVRATQTPDPVIGCAACMKVYFLYDLAQMPPSKRVERLEEMEEVLRNVVQHVEAGTWDYKVSKHPHIHVDKNALPD